METKSITLYIGLLEDREDLYDYLETKLCLAPYFGRNLDALYDLLTERREKVVYRIVGTSLFLKNFGEYGQKFMQTLKDAAEVNTRIEVKIIS